MQATVLSEMLGGAINYLATHLDALTDAQINALSDGLADGAPLASRMAVQAGREAARRLVEAHPDIATEEIHEATERAWRETLRAEGRLVAKGLL